MTNESEVSTVFVVDDNPTLLNALADFFKSANLKVETFSSAENFLASFCEAKQGCLVLDLKMPGMSGLDLLEQLTASRFEIPVIIVSGSARVADAVQSMRLGSFEFIERPYSSEFLLQRVLDAQEHDRMVRLEKSRQSELVLLYQKLTDREKEVVSLILLGNQSKAIGSALKVSVSTVDNHRANIMKKLKVETGADLIKVALEIGSAGKHH